MAAKYSLPCECGAVVPVDTSQAGQHVHCQCGRELEVPSMRAIRQLEPAPVDPNAAKSPRSSEWSRTAGGVFAAGAFLIICGLAVAGLSSLYRMQMTLPPPPQERIDEYVDQVDMADARQLLEVWNAMQANGLGEYQSSPYIIARQQVQFFTRISYAGLGVAALGLLLACSAALFRKRA